ncbi:MAG: PAB-dependent poly(A)-specific ribonuclease subunit 3 [Thelocarpon impressellum]|nr:MAG: PAB-dependent poly(A)-specific ribonuclease subunit 3 [Thelocarpon impressellum]
MPQTQADSLKKRLNVDSPTFTPSSLAGGSSRSGTPKNSAISPKAAGAAPFTPKAPASPMSDWVYVEPSPDYDRDQSTAGVDYGPTNLSFFDDDGNTWDVDLTFEIQGDQSATGLYLEGQGSISGAATAVEHQQSQVNPYATETLPSAYYHRGQASYAQPLQYHLYAPIGPHRENLLPHQRNVHDFFVPDNIREEMQREAEASLQVLPNSTLPTQVEHFHSLVPLDTVNQKSTAMFGYPSWIYKATSAKDGKVYALRRLEGYRLTNEKSIRCVQAWKRINNAGIVTVHDAFTTGTFGDRSLIFVTDYHPLSKTMYEHHFGPVARYTGRSSGQFIAESVLWGYMVQIASALKTIFESGLSARMIDPSKLLVTSKNRVRLNACSVLDVVQFDNQRSLAELQQEDMLRFGRLIVSLAANNPAVLQALPNLMDHIPPTYSSGFKDCVNWLLQIPQGQAVKTIDSFIQGISSQVMATYDSALHENDNYHSELSRELENGRIVRLLSKLGLINERPEFEHDRSWSETGDRYLLKLFRDYVFHQVDAQGNPVVDLAHILSCMAKLDAGVDERLSLVSRDEQNCLVVSYRELKRAVEAAFQDLVRASRRM